MQHSLEIFDNKSCMYVGTCIPNGGYASEITKKDEVLEETVRELSLSIRNSLVLTKTPFVTAEDLVLRKCGQTEPLPFEKCYPNA